jgi:hypothetical protein
MPYFGYIGGWSGAKMQQLADIVRGGVPSDGDTLLFDGVDRRWKFTATGDVAGSGSSTINAIARFSTTTGKAIKDSAVSISDGADVAGAKTLSLAGATSGVLTLRPAAATSSHTLTLPTAQGASGTFLRNDGSGVLQWASPGGPISGTVAALWSPVYGAPAAAGLALAGNATYNNATGARHVRLVHYHSDVSVLYAQTASLSAYWQLRVQMQLDIASSNVYDFVRLFGNATSADVPLVETGETAAWVLANPNDALFYWSHNGAAGIASTNTGVSHDHGYCTWTLTRSGANMRFEVTAHVDKPGTVFAWTLLSATPLPAGTIFGVAAHSSSSTNWTARVSTFELQLF